MSLQLDITIYKLTILVDQIVNDIYIKYQRFSPSVCKKAGNFRQENQNQISFVPNNKYSEYTLQNKF